MRGIGQERRRADGDPRHELDGHDAENQRGDDVELAAIVIGRDAVCVAGVVLPCCAGCDSSSFEERSYRGS